MTIAELIAKYNTAGTGLFRTGQNRGIGSDDMRDFVIDVTTLTDIPIPLPFWPLGGAANLTAHTAVDGNSFDLSFGNPNPLNSFDVSVIENFHFHSDDGTYHGHVEIVNEALNHYLQLLFTDGTDVTSVTMQDNLLTLIADNGVDNSSITFSPLNAIFNLADAGQFAIRDEAAADILVVTEDLTTLVATDGVDSSSLSLTPTGIIANLDTDGIDFINGLNLTDDTNGYSITSSATRFRIFSTGALNSVIDLENDEVRLSSEGQINLDASILTLGQVNAPTIGANTNNYAPDNSTVYRLTSNASRNITGWQPRGTSPIIFVFNAGSFDIVFTHDDTGNSTAANCFLVPGGGSLTLSPGQAVIWIYDLTSTRWRLISYSG